jgi:hypothetical protein
MSMIKKRRERKPERQERLIEAKLQRLQETTWVKLQEETSMKRVKLRVDLLKTTLAPIQKLESPHLSKMILVRMRVDLYNLTEEKAMMK